MQTGEGGAAACVGLGGVGADSMYRTRSRKSLFRPMELQLSRFMKPRTTYHLFCVNLSTVLVAARAKIIADDSRKINYMGNPINLDGLRR